MKHYSRTLFNGAVKPALIVGALSAIVASITSGSNGLKGSLLATLIVFIFFAIHLLLAKVTTVGSKNDFCNHDALVFFKSYCDSALLGLGTKLGGGSNSFCPGCDGGYYCLDRWRGKGILATRGCSWQQKMRVLTGQFLVTCSPAC